MLALCSLMASITYILIFHIIEFVILRKISKRIQLTTLAIVYMYVIIDALSNEPIATTFRPQLSEISS